MFLSKAPKGFSLVKFSTILWKDMPEERLYWILHKIGIKSRVLYDEECKALEELVFTEGN